MENVSCTCLHRVNDINEQVAQSPIDVSNLFRLAEKTPTVLRQCCRCTAGCQQSIRILQIFSECLARLMALLDVAWIAATGKVDDSKGAPNKESLQAASEKPTESQPRDLLDLTDILTTATVNDFLLDETECQMSLFKVFHNTAKLLNHTSMELDDRVARILFSERNHGLYEQTTPKTLHELARSSKAVLEKSYFALGRYGD